jgi:hypothetical protein
MSGVGTTDQVEPFQCSATGSIGPPRGAANPTAQASVSEVAVSPNKIPVAFGSSTFGVGVCDQPEPSKEAARVRAIPEKVSANVPTAVNPAPVGVMPPSDPGEGSAVAATAHDDPVQCSIRGRLRGLSPAAPAAHTSEEDRTATPDRESP